MKIKQSMTAVLSAAMVVVGAGVASANNTIASTVETTGTSTDFTFNGTTLALSGALPVDATDVNGNVDLGTFYLSTLTEVPGTASSGALGTGAEFSGGTFDISTSGTSGNLLSGTFTSSVLSSTNGSTGDILNTLLNDVQYTGGTFLTEYNAKYGGSGAIGNLTLDLSAITPPLSETNGNLNKFTAEGSSSTFDATVNSLPAVPEPSTVASFAFGGLGVLGLMLRARRGSRLAA